MQNYKPSIKYGIIWGIISILVFMLQWALAPESLFSLKSFAASIVIGALGLPIFFMIIAARDNKPTFKNYNFGRAFSTAILTAIVSSVIYLSFNFFFNAVIDPELPDFLEAIQMDNLEEAYDQEKLTDKQYSDAKEQIGAMFNRMRSGLGSLIMTGIFLIWYTILALIVGAVQKEQSEQDLFA